MRGWSAWTIYSSTTDPAAKLIRKSDGQPARLCHALHAIVENRHGLVLAVEVNSPLGNSEPTTALSLVDRVKERFKISPKALGADKGYEQAPFLEALEKRKIRPHVAVKDGVHEIVARTNARRKITNLFMSPLATNSLSE